MDYYDVIEGDVNDYATWDDPDPMEVTAAGKVLVCGALAGIMLLAGTAFVAELGLRYVAGRVLGGGS